MNEYAQKIRRELHRHPEIGFDLPKTLATLRRELDGMGVEYTEKYGTDTLNQFGASAYDCVYAIYYAMQAAIEAGETVDVTISASDLCEILKAQFQGGFSYSGVTGENITWDENGYVAKGAVKYVLKEAD